MAWCVAGSPALSDVHAANPLSCRNGIVSPRLSLFHSVYQMQQSIFPQGAVPLSLKHFSVSYKYLNHVFRKLFPPSRMGAMGGIKVS